MDQKTMDYLRTIMALEKEKYTQEKLIEELYDEARQLGVKEITQWDKPHKERTSLRSCIFGGICVGVIAAIISFIIFMVFKSVELESNFILFVFQHFDQLLLCAVQGLGIGAGVAVILSIVSFVIFKVSRKKKYKSDLKDFGNAMELDNQRVEIENGKKEILLQEINSIKESLEETKNTLRKVYEVGILYKKYWSIIPVTRFYEYFESGRSNTFKGHEGAYEIYEKEIRLDRISGKLDDIISRLDRIREGQFQLYQVINEGNQKVEALFGSVKESMNRIESSAQITAYNTHVSAQNSEAIKNLIFYRQLLDTHK